MFVIKIIAAVVALGILYLAGRVVGYLGYKLFDRFRDVKKSIKR